MAHKPSEVRTYLTVYVLLLVLLAVTVLAAQYEVGRWNIAVTLTIASIKAVLIVLFFMHVKEGTPLVKLVVIIGLFWMAILFSLTLSDYWSRQWDPQIEVSDIQQVTTTHPRHIGAGHPAPMASLARS